MTKNTKTIIGVGVGVLLLLWLRNRNKSEQVLRGSDAGDSEGAGNAGRSMSGGGGIGGAISGIFGGGSGSGGGGVAPSPVVTNTLRPMPIAQSPVYTSPANARPYTSPVSRDVISSVNSRPATIPNTTQDVVQTSSRSNFLTFNGSFRSPSNLDFDGSIID